MIAQKNRLKKADFERIFKNGNKSYNQSYNIRYVANGLDYCRFAIIVSNKISNNSTERNKIRRRIKAVLLENMANFRQNIDLIITVLPPVKKLDFQEIRTSLSELLKKYKVLVWIIYTIIPGILL